MTYICFIYIVYILCIYSIYIQYIWFIYCFTVSSVCRPYRCIVILSLNSSLFSHYFLPLHSTVFFIPCVYFMFSLVFIILLSFLLILTIVFPFLFNFSGFASAGSPSSLLYSLIYLWLPILLLLLLFELYHSPYIPPSFLFSNCKAYYSYDSFILFSLSGLHLHIPDLSYLHMFLQKKMKALSFNEKGQP